MYISIIYMCLLSFAKKIVFYVKERKFVLSILALNFVFLHFMERFCEHVACEDIHAIFSFHF
jgi:hypothetical protein